MCSFRRRKLGHPPRSHKLPLHGDPTCLCLSVSPSATALSDARDEVRRRIVAGDIPTDGLVVELAAGDYPLAEPLRLGPEDTGSASAPITWRAQAGKTYVFLAASCCRTSSPSPMPKFASASPRRRATTSGRSTCGPTASPTSASPSPVDWSCSSTRTDDPGTLAKTRIRQDHRPRRWRARRCAWHQG